MENSMLTPNLLLYFMYDHSQGKCALTNLVLVSSFGILMGIFIPLRERD